MYLLMKLLMTGLLAGLAMGGFLKLVQVQSGKMVYVLLLNVDYIPGLSNLQLNEAFEFLLHLAVSVILIPAFYFPLKKMKLHRKIYPYAVINLATGGLLFCTTAFSERTPAFTDGMALLFWLAGHLIYGTLVGIILFNMRLDSDENETKNKKSI